MADLLTRPDSRPELEPAREPETLAERLLDTQAPQRPQSSTRIRIEVDGRVVEGFEGQTILEVCRDNGIEIPTLCYEPKLPGLRRLPDVRRRGRGRGAPADLVLARVRAGDEGPDPDRGGPPPAPDQPRADLQRPQRLLPAAVPEQVPQPHRHPGLPQGQRRGRLAREHPDLQADDPVPQRPRPRLPRPVRGALPARRGGRGDRHPRQPSLRRRPGPQGDARRGRRPAAAVRAPGAVGPDRRGHRLRAGRHGRRVLPAAGRPRRHGLRARPGPRRDAPLRDPAVPPAQDRGARGGVRVGHPARRQDRVQRRARSRLHPRRPDQPRLRLGRRGDRLLRHEQAGHPRRGRGRGARRARVPADGDARAALPRACRQARRRHRRRVHLDGLLADIGPPGRVGGHASSTAAT